MTTLTLKSFSQEVSIVSQDTVRYFVTFAREDGRELRLPVPKETSEAIIKFLWAGSDAPQNAPEAVEEEPEIPEEATEFGGEEPEPDLSGTCPHCNYPEGPGGARFKGLYDPTDVCPGCGYVPGEEPMESVPQSEEEVPSL